MKDINDILFIVEARLHSSRMHQKMIRDFANTTLLDLLLSKLKSIDLIPKDNLYLSAYEDEIKDIGNKHNINIFNRSIESANAEDLQTIKEWHNKLPFKYVIAINPCTPLIKIETIKDFIKYFIESEDEGAFSVFKKQTYYWDKNGKMITNWPDGQQMFNTKFIDPIYEAAHVLYASRLDIIKKGYYITDKLPVEPHLFVINELEAFDIDYDYQFKVAEQLYKIEKNV
tara:strand:- start:1187 stop:1870 length:684 start_codon:yes stop_codon:yes gene_type:complete